MINFSLPPPPAPLGRARRLLPPLAPLLRPPRRLGEYSGCSPRAPSPTSHRPGPRSVCGGSGGMGPHCRDGQAGSSLQRPGCCAGVGVPMHPRCGPPRTPPRATSSPPRPVTGGDPAPGGLPDGWDEAGLVPRAGTRCPGFGSVPGEVTAAGFPALCPHVPAATSTGRRHLCRRVPWGVPRSPCPHPPAGGKQTNKGSASCRTYPNPSKRACGVGCPSAHPPFGAGGQFGLFKHPRERGYPLARPPLGARLLLLPAPRQPGRAGKLWPRPARLSPGLTRGDTAGRPQGSRSQGPGGSGVESGEGRGSVAAALG